MNSRSKRLVILVLSLAIVFMLSCNLPNVLQEEVPSSKSELQEMYIKKPESGKGFYTISVRYNWRMGDMDFKIFCTFPGEDDGKPVTESLPITHQGSSLDYQFYIDIPGSYDVSCADTNKKEIFSSITVARESPTVVNENAESWDQLPKPGDFTTAALTAPMPRPKLAWMCSCWDPVKTQEPLAITVSSGKLSTACKDKGSEGTFDGLWSGNTIAFTFVCNRIQPVDLGGTIWHMAYTIKGTGKFTTSREALGMADWSIGGSCEGTGCSVDSDAGTTPWSMTFSP